MAYENRRNSFFSFICMVWATLYVSSSQAQSCAELLNENFAAKNPTAIRPSAEYSQPDSRSLTQYNAITNYKKRLRARSLRNFVPRGGLVIDVGGQGRAIHEMAEKSDVNAVVINTQDQVDASFLHKNLNGTFTYRKGWAQTILPEYQRQADLVLDIWGGFSYEMDKASMLNLIYSALKPGGRAVILYHLKKTPAMVKVRMGRPKKTRLFHIHKWLAENYPETVSWHPAGQEISDADILVIEKPKDDSGPEFFPLRMTKGRLVEGKAKDAEGRPLQVVPESEFEPFSPE